MVERSRPQYEEETKMIDTRSSKGRRDADDGGFMGAEDKKL